MHNLHYVSAVQSVNTCLSPLVPFLLPTFRAHTSSLLLDSAIWSHQLCSWLGKGWRRRVGGSGDRSFQMKEVKEGNVLS